ncbi:MAG: site-specific DNA-methyltransferase [Methanobrevibacter sp.]|nr:site-specific DNA-methyltransferase [Methanobrevibacter sp.]
MGSIEKIENVDVKKLIPYGNNAKIHGKHQLEKLKESISEFGFLTPCLIDKDFNLIAGHGRVLAAEELKMKTVPCVFVEGLTETQRKAYILADNRLGELGEWDMELVAKELLDLSEDGFNIDLTGFSIDDSFLDGEPVSDVVDKSMEDYLESIDKSITKMGQIWELGKHRLMIGDSTQIEQVLDLLGGGSIDLLVTDPPYNVNVESGNNLKIENDNMKDEDFEKFLYSCFSNAASVMKQGAAFYIWHADSNGYVFRKCAIESGLMIKENLIWVKQHFTLGRQDYQWQHEPCLYGWKPGAAHYFSEKRNISTIIKSIDNLENGTLEDYKKFVEELKESSSVQFFDKPIKDDLHPTMKPVELIEKQIKNSSREGDSVLDLFGGSGTTLLACETLKRKCFMMEYDPKYADVIISRWEELTGEKAKLINQIS